MAPKPPRNVQADFKPDDGASAQHKKKKGFSVGPANLPDGTYRRKVKKIKTDLIHKAKVRKAYAKIKERDLPAILEKSHYSATTDGGEENISDTSRPASSSKGPELHPERVQMLEEAEKRRQNIKEAAANQLAGPRGRRKRRPKPSSFEKELAVAKKREEEAERRKKLREESLQIRKAMIKAKRPDQFGKPRLGRQSSVLLQKVKRMVGEA
ncbi:hypothetical protein KEM54_000907 [Ascosphaera aggregata]|nr:hypothetical protein KEM54_000907 [Ascosphaera aggregata]